MPKQHKQDDPDMDETYIRIASTFIRVGMMLERHKDQIDQEEKDEQQHNTTH